MYYYSQFARQHGECYRSFIFFSIFNTYRAWIDLDLTTEQWIQYNCCQHQICTITSNNYIFSLTLPIFQVFVFDAIDHYRNQRCLCGQNKHSIVLLRRNWCQLLRYTTYTTDITLSSIGCGLWRHETEYLVLLTQWHRFRRHSGNFSNIQTRMADSNYTWAITCYSTVITNHIHKIYRCWWLVPLGGVIYYK